MLRLPDSGRVRCEDEDKEKTFENPAAFCKAQRQSANTTSEFRMAVGSLKPTFALKKKNQLSAYNGRDEMP